jgi:glycosyltransferase involved in cell wall biosynthesis
MCEMLASQGHEVRCVGTCETAGHLGTSVFDFLQNSIRVEKLQGHSYFRFRNVAYRLVENLDEIDPLRWKPEILLTYGGTQQDFAGHKRAKAAGCKIVFGLRNGLYRDKDFFRFCDAILTPSQWMSDWYKRTIGLDSTPLPLPINTEDCVSPVSEPYFITYVNPNHEKGEQIVRAIATALSGRSFQIVESRGKAGGGWPANCKIVGPFANPHEIYRQTKILLVPSLWEEPGGRVVCEAMLNGIPPIVSDRGALPEIANGGGFIIPTARKLFDHSPVTPEEMLPWIETITRLKDSFEYHMAVKSAYAASQRYDAAALTPVYCDFFESVLKGVPGWVPTRTPASRDRDSSLTNTEKAS